MGLDGVELVIRTEERFGISLPDAECARMVTVSDLADAVMARLPRQADSCATARAFYELRRLFTTHAGLERCMIRPGTRLAALFPMERRSVWPGLCKADRRLPGLTISREGRMRLTQIHIAGIVAGLFISLAILVGLGIPSGIPWAVLACVTGVLSGGLFESRYRLAFPENLVTVGDVAKTIAPVTMPPTGAHRHSQTRQLVLTEVRRLTAETLDLPFEQVQPQSRFARDLGI